MSLYERSKSILAAYGLMSFIGTLVMAFAIIVFGVTIGSAISDRTQQFQAGGEDIEEGAILHLVASGPLSELTMTPWQAFVQEDEGRFSATDLSLGLKRAANDDRIVGLLLEVGAVEWSLSDIEEFEYAMSLFRDSGKWTRSYLHSAANNGPYAVAISADKVHLAPPGEVGLSGLKVEAPFLKGTMDKLGIQWSVEKRKNYKSAANRYIRTGFDTYEKEALSTLANDLEQELLTHIAKRRDVAQSRAQSWIQTGPHAAKAALQRRIIDKIAYRDEILDAQEEESLISFTRYLKNHNEVTWTMDPKATVAMIIAEGPIVDASDSSASVINAREMAQLFKEAREEAVDGIVLRVDSPGGSYIASDLIRREVEQTRAAGIPVVISMASFAASGGYFISMQADHIFADASTITGSIGVVTAFPNARGLLEQKLGITFDRYETQPGTGFPSIYYGSSPQQQRSIAAMADRAYQDFVTKAAHGRELSVSALEAAAQGRVWSGRRAHELKLVDDIGGVLAAIDWLKVHLGHEATDTVELQIYPNPEQVWLRWVKSLGEAQAQISIPAQIEGLMKHIEKTTIEDRLLTMPSIKIQL